METSHSFSLEPAVRRIVSVANRLDRGRGAGVTMAQRREADAGVSRRLGWVVMPSGPKPAEQRDVLVPVDGGRIRVRLYVPHRSSSGNGGRFPLHVFFHGGGWCVGTIGSRDARCRAIAAGAHCIVASVDYRLAPENLYPTAPEDCYAALCWLVEHADELDVDTKIDTSRVAVGGESAGGNLAAVVCLMARDRNGPTIVHQWLDVPATDLTMSQPSVHNTPDGYLLTYGDMLEYRDSYLPDISHATEPYASPLHAVGYGPGLAGLPPARILTCGADPLRDDGRVYAEALAAAGVAVEHVHLAGHVHPSFAFTRLVRSARADERSAIAALRAGLRHRNITMTDRYRSPMPDADPTADPSTLDTAVSAMLTDAGEIALRYFRTAIAAEDKDTGGVHGFDPVTEADRSIEDLLRARLHETFGDHEVLGEERCSSGTPGRYQWLIDPIDGTKAFVTGSPLWGILLGLLDRGVPVAGWMHQPYLGETFGGKTFAAAADGQAWVERHGQRTPLATRDRHSITEAQMYTTFPGMFREPGERAAFDRLSNTVQLARFGGDCYAYCLLAMGQIDLVVEASLQPYDIVALIPIVEAAGGVVTGRHGESAASGGFVVASANQQIHEQALVILNQQS